MEYMWEDGVRTHCFDALGTAGVSFTGYYPLKVLLMPEGITAGAIRGRDESLIDLCKDCGYRYFHRLHIELFGNTRRT